MRTFRKSGGGPPFKRVGGYYFYYREEILRFSKRLQNLYGNDHTDEEPRAMALIDVLQFLNDEELEVEKIEYNDSNDTYSISADYEIDGQSYPFLLTTSEGPQEIGIFMTSPTKIPKTRAKEAALVLNHLNWGMRFGKLVMTDTGEIEFDCAIPVEGAKAEPEQFARLLKSAADAFFHIRVESIAAAAFTKRSAADIIDAFEKAMAMSDEAQWRIVT